MRYSTLLGLLFLTAACTDQVNVTVKNTNDFALKNESVVVAWDKLSAKLKNATRENIVVCGPNGEQIASQVLFEGGDTPVGVLFQTDVAAESENGYVLKTGLREEFDTLAYGRFVPERKDDFAWENDKIAYRMYGPALEADGEISNGIDIWLKRTPKMIIDKWYTKGYDYHSDSGEGLDCYKVGRTLGAGANTPVIGDSLVLSNNFVSYRVLENGPLRIRFELLYAPFLVDGVAVTQKRVITLDGGNNMNTVETTYSGNFDQLDVATGIVVRNVEGEKTSLDSQTIAYAEPEDPNNGITYVAVVTKEEGEPRRIKNHILKGATVKNGEPYTYRCGAYWSKYGINNEADWLQTIEKERARFKNDLLITIE